MISTTSSVPKTLTITTDELDIERRFKKCLFDIVELYSKLESGKLTVSYGGRPVRALPTDIIRVVSEYNQNDLSDLLIRNIILNFIMSSEKKSAYSSILLMKMLRKTCNFKHVQRATRDNIRDLIKIHLGNGICSQIVNEIIDLNPISSLEFVEGTKSNFMMSATHTLGIEGNIPNGFLVDLKNVKGIYPIVIDGVLEKVSEIHNLLTTSGENGQSILLIAKDFSPDIVNTLYQNYKNKKLSVIPFIAKKIDNIESLRKEDICIIELENAISLTYIDASDLKRSLDVLFNASGIKLIGVDGVDRHTVISIPKHFKKQAGLIEDRVRSCLSFVLEACKYGLIINSENKPISGAKQFKSAKNVINSLESFEKNLGGLIVLDR